MECLAVGIPLGRQAPLSPGPAGPPPPPSTQPCTFTRTHALFVPPTPSPPTIVSSAPHPFNRGKWTWHVAAVVVVSAVLHPLSLLSGRSRPTASRRQQVCSTGGGQVHAPPFLACRMACVAHQHRHQRNTAVTISGDHHSTAAPDRGQAWLFYSIVAAGGLPSLCAFGQLQLGTLLRLMLVGPSCQIAIACIVYLSCGFPRPQREGNEQGSHLLGRWGGLPPLQSSSPPPATCLQAERNTLHSESTRAPDAALTPHHTSVSCTALTSRVRPQQCATSERAHPNTTISRTSHGSQATVRAAYTAAPPYKRQHGTGPRARPGTAAFV